MAGRPEERIKEGDFRHYDFSVAEVLEATEKFLKYVGYELLPREWVGFVQPSFRARRKAGEKTYELVGVVMKGLEESVQGCAQLQALKAVLGEEIDYALVLPPVNEYLLLEFLQEEKGRWFFGMKEQGLMMWLCNPANDSLWCILGAPRDRRFDNYFILTKFQVEPVISQRLSAQLLAEEEEEYGSPPGQA